MVLIDLISIHNFIFSAQLKNGISREDEILFYIIIILQETFCRISPEHWFWKAVHKWESWKLCAKFQNMLLCI